MLLRNEREQASQQAKGLRQQLVRAERQHGEAAAALGLQQLREEARRAEEAEAAAARVEGLEDEVRVARLAAQITNDTRGKELHIARAETVAVKRGVAHRLEQRWQRLLVQLCWQGWCRLRSENLLRKFSGQRLVRARRRRSGTAAAAAAAQGEQGAPSRSGSGLLSAGGVGFLRRSLSRGSLSGGSSSEA